MTTQVSLSVNDTPISLDYFIQGFIHRVTAGILAGLSGTGEIGTLNLSIDEGGQVTIDLNNAQVPVNEFVNKIIKNTITGMVSPLKGVDEISKLTITIKS